MESAIAITQGYRVLAESMVEEDLADERKANLERYLHWSEECVRRSPMNSDLYDQLAKAWWLRSSIEHDRRLEAAEQALAASARAAELAPAYAPAFGALAYYHQRLATLYTAEGLPEKAREHEAAAAKAKARSDEIWAAG